MKNFNNIGRGVALATSTLALGSALAISSSISSAQAVTFVPGPGISTINFSGSVNVDGVPTYDDPLTSPVVSFFNLTVQPTTNGVFAPSLIGTSVSIPTLTLSGASVTSTTGTRKDIAYTTVSPDTPTFTFAHGLKFVADSLSGLATARTFSNTLNASTYDISPITGTFFDTINNTVVGAGSLTFNSSISNGLGSISGTFSIDNSTVSRTPEPTATVALVALGMGAFFTSNLARKKKVMVKA